MRKRIGLSLLLGLFLGGCVASNLAEFQRAMASDPATVCVNLQLSTPWGTQLTRGARTACLNCRVQCSPDGSMTVEAVK